MSNLLLKQAPQSFVLQPQQSHPRLSLSRVLYVKFLRWVEKATPGDLRKLAVRTGGVIFLAGLVGSTQFTLGFLLAAAKWNGCRIPLFLALTLTLNARRIVRLVTRHRFTRKGANQHTYKGLPVDELATYLLERREFTRDPACAKFGLNWKKHQAIATELEHHQVLVRGPANNARILNETITREQLVRQLRDDFPLAFADGQWVERRGSYELFLRDKDREQQKLQAEVGRWERRAIKAKEAIKEARQLTDMQRALAVA